MRQDRAVRANRLSAAKEKLFEKYLRGQVGPKPETSPPITPRPTREPIPLSFAQQQVWVHSQLAGEIPIYNETLTIYRRGHLDVAVLERCFVEIIRRHEAWRTNFDVLNGHPIQVVRPTPECFAVHVIDLRHLNEPGREEEAMRVATADAQKPFDLQKDSLLRATLIRLADEDYRLYMTFHQIIFDAASAYNVLLPELSTLYETFFAGRPSPLQQLPIQYGDFAYWQRKLLTPETWSKNLAYWRDKLAGALPVLEWPNDYWRPPVETHRGAVHRFKLKHSLIPSLRAFCQLEGASAYMTLLAAFVALLNRYTGQEDIVVGGLSAGRKRRETESVVGYFVNPFVLRFDLSGSPSFRDLVRRARGVVLDALAHEEVPFEQVVQELRMKPNPGRNPIFQIIVSQQPHPSISDPAWDLVTEEVSNGGSKLDLLMVIDDRGKEISGPITYNPDLFDASTIARMVEHWETLIARALAKPDLPIG